MGNRKKRFNNQITHNLLTLVLCLQWPLAGLADDDSALKPAVPTMDETKSGESPADTAHSSNTINDTTITKTLTGGVQKRQANLPETDRIGGPENPSADPEAAHNAGLQSGTATRDENSPAFKLTIQKLAAKEKLTSDDYRSLGIGVLGYAKSQSLFSFSKGGTVTELYRGCPAEKAGIREGDYEKSTDEIDAQTDYHGLTGFICGLAGKAVTVTIERGWHQLKFHLVRMNVEDIPDARIRRAYERLITRMAAKLVKAYPQLDPQTLGLKN